MAQIINTNMMSLNSQRSLNRSQMSMQTSLARLSSGLRINSARDDAAGLAISERLTAQIRGLEQANRNGNDGISLMQTAEGALDEVSNMLQRMRELTVQAANGTVSNADKNSLQDEYRELSAEIKRVINTASFNNVNLLKGGSQLSFQVGWQKGADNVINVSLGHMSTNTVANGGLKELVSATPFSIGSGGSFQKVLSLLDTSIDTVTQKRADFGAKQNRIESTLRNNANVIENQSAARSRIRDADFAVETANLTKTQILQQAGTAMLAQANQLPQNILQLLQ